MGIVQSNRRGREATSAPESPGKAGFDPTVTTVVDAIAYVKEHPEERDAVVAAERSGKNRVTLMEALDG